MVSTSTLPLIAAIIVALTSSTTAFTFGKKNAPTSKLPLPTLDKETNRYTKSPQDDGEYPYDALGSALRHGPSPFLTRVTNPDEYEQGILKYMLSAKCDRAEATGNVDAKLNNAADWVYQKMEEKNGKPKVDYTRLDKKQAILTVVWALGVTPVALNVVLSTADQFMNSPGPSVIKH